MIDLAQPHYPNHSTQVAKPDMTEQLYHLDSYLREIKAKVLAAHDGAVILNKTIFYPGGGGQPADGGKIISQGYVSRITEVEKIEGQIHHTLAGPTPEAGQFVKCKIDWERRYRLMRTHTALHILCGVIWRDYRAHVTGGNMQPCLGRLDFELESMTSDFTNEIERSINKEVEAARKVEVKILPRAEAFAIPDLIRAKINRLPENIAEVRTVNIVGLDLQADGGTHVANTKEVGEIRVVEHKSKGKINKRIKIELDDEFVENSDYSTSSI